MTKAPFDIITSETTSIIDKGWSWVVMLASFGALFIAVGYQRSFGMLYVAFQDRYNYSSSIISIVNGTQTFTYCFSSMLVMSFALKKISIRTSCLIGASIQTAGVIASSVHSDIVSLIVCQGFMFGLGHSFLYLPTILAVSQYFDRHRPVAMAMATCGSSLGGITFPYITRFLLKVFGLDGSLLLLGALIFQQMVFHTLNRPRTAAPEKSLVVHNDPKVNVPCIDDSQNHQNSSNSSNNKDIVTKSSNNGNNNIDTAANFIDTGTENTLKVSNVESEKYDSNNTKDLALKGSNGHLNEDDVMTQSHESNSDSKQIVQLYSSQTLIKPRILVLNGERLYSSQNSLPPGFSTEDSERSYGANSKPKKGSKDVLIDTILLGLSSSFSSLDHIHASLPSLMASPSVSANHRRNGGVGDVEEPTAHETSVALLTNSNVPETSEPKVERYPLSRLLRLPSFWLLGLYMVGGIISAGCPSIFIPPLSKEKGLTDDDSTFILMISSASDLLGRVIIGVLLHFRLLQPYTLAAIPLIVVAVLFNLTFIFSTFSSLLFMALVYGVTSGMYWTLSNLVVIEVLGLANLAPAMGIYAFIYGFTTSASYPLAGWLSEETGSYSSSFSYFGFMGLVSALALILVVLPPYKSKCTNLVCSSR